MEHSGDIQVEVLVRADNPPDLVTLDNIDRARPRPEVIERCRRWFASRGLRCHGTDFGVVCTGSEDAIAEVFGSATSPRAPMEITDDVAQVTVVRGPEYF